MRNFTIEEMIATEKTIFDDYSHKVRIDKSALLLREDEDREVRIQTYPISAHNSVFGMRVESKSGSDDLAREIALRRPRRSFDTEYNRMYEEDRTVVVGLSIANMVTIVNKGGMFTILNPKSFVKAAQALTDLKEQINYKKLTILSYTPPDESEMAEIDTFMNTVNDIIVKYQQMQPRVNLFGKFGGRVSATSLIGEDGNLEITISRDKSKNDIRSRATSLNKLTRRNSPYVV